MKNRRKQIITLYDLMFRSGRAHKLVNLITIYRILTFPLLLYLIFTQQFEVFKWLLAVSFFTDAIDGQLARKYKVSSIIGAKLDSIGDDLTVLAGTIGLAHLHWDFFYGQIEVLSLLFIMFLIETGYGFMKYGKPTSFHTIGAKIAAVLQGLFLISVFFFEPIQYFLYYSAIIVTALQLTEETIMIHFVPTWKKDVKGIYWAIKIARGHRAFRQQNLES